jgi:hypothetical protein
VRLRAWAFSILTAKLRLYFKVLRNKKKMDKGEIILKYFEGDFRGLNKYEK